MGSKPRAFRFDVGPGASPSRTSISRSAGSKRKVVFSFPRREREARATILRLREHRLAAERQTTEVVVTGAASAKGVTINLLQRHPYSLVYDKDGASGPGQIEVPGDARRGDIRSTPACASGTSRPASSLTGRPQMHWAILQMTPPHPAKGRHRGRARPLLVDVAEGDTNVNGRMANNYSRQTVGGRVFTFNLRVSLRPLHGALLTSEALYR